MMTAALTPLAPVPLRLFPENSLLLCVDIQERLCPAMPEGAFSSLMRNAKHLISAATTLGVPVIVSEQYRRGLGLTVSEIAAQLPVDAINLEKVEFSVWANSGLASAIVNTRRSQLVLFGMEAHICVYQSVRDLVHAGFQVHVPHDAVCSRLDENARVGLALAERAGGVVTATETILFDWLHRAGTPQFKAISALVR
jgi:nicotinamidase-related amidase